jgi:hypothetical protein
MGPNRIPASGTSAALTLKVAPVPIMGKAGTSVTTAMRAAHTAITAGCVDRIESLPFISLLLMLA